MNSKFIFMVNFCVNPWAVERFLDPLIGPGAPFTPLLVRLIFMGVTLIEYYIHIATVGVCGTFDLQWLVIISC